MSTPDWRIPPPKRFRTLHPSSMSAREPASAAPTGQPSPFEKLTITVSAHAANSASVVPLAALAFQSRAPSRCTGSERARATSVIARSAGSGVIIPPAPLCVFSTHTRLGPGTCGDGTRIVAVSAAASMTGPAPCTGRTWTPESAAAPAIS